MTIKHETVVCPRCGQTFECKVGSVSICSCSQVELSRTQRENIKAHYSECLCLSCLRDYAAKTDKTLAADSSVYGFDKLHN